MVRVLDFLRVILLDGRFDSVRAVVLVLLVCWLVGFGLALGGLPQAFREARGAPRYALSLAGLAAAAIVLRLFYVPRTPEIQWRLTFAHFEGGGVATGYADIHKYGAALPLAGRLLHELVSSGDEVFFTFNAVIGGLTVVPLAALVREVGGSVQQALLCAFVLAITPQHAWYAHTEGPFTLDAFATLVACWTTARWARQGSLRALWGAVVATMTVVECRTEAILTVPVLLGLALALTPGFPWRRPATWLAAGAFLGLVTPHLRLAVPSALVEASIRATYLQPGQVWKPTYQLLFLFEPDMHPTVLLALVPLAVFVRGVPRSVVAWALVAALVVALPGVDVDPVPTSVSVTRYQLRVLPFVTLLSGLGLSALASAPGGLLLAGIAAIGALTGLPAARTDSVLRREYDFVSEHLAQVPSNCTITSFLDQGDATLQPPLQLSELRGYRHAWRDLAAPPPEPGACWYYYRSGSCTALYHGGPNGWGKETPACADFETRFRMEAVAEDLLPSDLVGPMGVESRFPGLPQRVGFYRILGSAEP